MQAMSVGRLHAQFDYALDDMRQAFHVLRAQLHINFDKDRNAYVSCVHGNNTHPVGLPEETEYVKEIEMGGVGHLHDNAGTC